MSNVVNKLWSMINMNGAEEPEDGYEEPEYVTEPEEEDEPRGLFGRKNNKVVNMDRQVKMSILQPTGLESAVEICDLLRERKSVIINLEYVNKDVSRRIIDIVGGAVHVLDAHMQKVSNSIFVVAPYNYNIDTDVKEETRSKSPVSWLKSSNG